MYNHYGSGGGHGLPSYSGSKGGYGKGKGGGPSPVSMLLVGAVLVCALLGVFLVRTRSQVTTLQHQLHSAHDEMDALRNQLIITQNHLTQKERETTVVQTTLHSYEQRVQGLDQEKQKLQIEIERLHAAALEQADHAAQYHKQLVDELALHQSREQNWMHLQGEWEKIEKEWEAEFHRLREQLVQAKLQPVVPEAAKVLPHHIDAAPSPPMVMDWPPFSDTPASPQPTPAQAVPTPPTPVQADLGRRGMGGDLPAGGTPQPMPGSGGMPQPMPGSGGMPQPMHGGLGPHPGQQPPAQHAPTPPANDPNQHPPVPGPAHDWAQWAPNDYFDPHSFYADYPGFVPDHPAGGAGGTGQAAPHNPPPPNAGHHGQNVHDFNDPLFAQQPHGVLGHLGLGGHHPTGQQQQQQHHDANQHGGVWDHHTGSMHHDDQAAAAFAARDQALIAAQHRAAGVHNSVPQHGMDWHNPPPPHHPPPAYDPRGHVQDDLMWKLGMGGVPDQEEWNAHHDAHHDMHAQQQQQQQQQQQHQGHHQQHHW